MKKIMIFVIVVIGFFTQGFAKDYGSQLLFFNGIGTKLGSVNSNQVGFEEQVKIVRDKLGQGSNRVIVGQSQGGVRALAYASMYPNETRAVITIGSPVTGHPALSTFRALQSLINQRDNQIRKGIQCVKNLYDTWHTLGNALRPIIQMVDGDFANDLIESLGWGDDAQDAYVNISSFLGLAAGDSYPGITDMTPSSDFMNRWIYPRTIYHNVMSSGTAQVAHTGTRYETRYKTEIRKVQSGTKTEYKIVRYNSINILGKIINIPVYGFVSSPVYTFFTVQVPYTVSVPYTYYTTEQVTTVKTVTETVKRFNNKYLAFICGTNNDVTTINGSPFTRDQILEYGSNMKTLSNISLGIAAGNLFIGLAGGLVPGTGVVNFFSAATWTSMGLTLSAASNVLTNYTNVTGDIIGDRNNDSLIPYRVQSFNIEQFGGGTKLGLGYYAHPVNHEQEMTASEIWGSGSLGSATVTGGTLGTLLKELCDLRVMEKSDDGYVGRNAQWK